MALYGYQGLVKAPESTDYFKDLRADIDAAVKAKGAEEAVEEAVKEAMGAVPEQFSSNYYGADYDALRQMSQILKDRRDELLATEEGRETFNALLSQIDYFGKNQKAFASATKPVLTENTLYAMQGASPEKWGGMVDKHSLQDYTNWKTQHDNPMYTVRVDGDKFILSDASGDHSVQDPYLVDASFFDPNQHLELPPAVRPQDWYAVHRPRNEAATFNDRQAAVDWMTGSLMTDTSGVSKRDAIRWYVDSEANTDNLTQEQVLSNANAQERAVTAYAEAALPSDWSPSDTSTSSRTTAPTTEQKRRTAFNNSIDATITSEETVVAFDQTTGNQSIDVVNVADYGFPSEYRPNIDTSSFPEGSRIEDSNGIAVEIEGTHIIMTTGQIPVLVGSNISDPIELTGQIESSVRRQIDELYGSGSYDRIIEKLREEAYSN